MAAVNRGWPAIAPERPTTASWDNLISRSHDRRDSLGESVFSENDVRRRPQSTASDFAVRVRPRGRLVERPSSSGDLFAANRTDSPGRRPTKPRTMTYHAGERDSTHFANHMVAMTGSPSPLRTMRTLRSSDSMPELNLGASADKNKYTTDAQQNHHRSLSRPSISARPSRLAESITMADLEDAQIPHDPPPVNRRARSNSEGRMRAMSWHGKQPPMEPNIFQANPLPNASMRNSVAGWQRRPEMIKHTRPQKPRPNELFEKLPHDVLDLIMGHLRILHMENSSSCATCWLRDCCSVSVSNRGWLKAARDAMYEDIQLVGPDSVQQRKKYKGVYSTRLVLLRRTLRADPKLAATVRFLKVPALPDDAPMDVMEYHDIVASVVMACPNLQRLDGFYPIYNHGESRLFNALSSREELKEMTWVVDAMSLDVEGSRSGGHKAKSSKSKNRHSRHQSSVSSIWNPNSYLSAAHANKFVRHHMGWSKLTHLTIHCLPGAQLHTPNSLLNVVQTYLTSLQSLHLSHVPPQAFNDGNLLCLPKPLQKLTLSHCTGVTSAGLSAFATSPSAQSLEKFTLMHQNLDTLAVVVRLLANLTRLTTFSLVQPTAPVLPDDELGFLMMPYLGSNSLRFLHWDIFESAISTRAGDLPGTKTDDILARSIAANGFPNLRFLRVPCDPDGMYQALCRPKERADLPGDRYRNGLVNQASSTARSVSGGATRSNTTAGEQLNTVIPKPYAASNTLGPYNSSAISLVLPSAVSDSSVDCVGRPTSSLSSNDHVKVLPVREAGSDLHQARLRAQARLEAARGFPLFEANITDEEGMLIESTGLAGYLGDVRSNIVYTLSPDAGACDERGGLVGVMDLLSDGGEDLFGKGDAASRSGAGYGTGYMASEFAKAQVQASALKEGNEGIKGKNAKLSRNSHKSKESVVDEDEGRKVKDGCTGRWNSQNTENFTADRKMADRWSHVERGRWRGRVELS
ncbi:hypothetical protein N0V93_000951 [Gnomoniopsis smithogilvyi]|uniref:Uncharacterized protein n=1 Tax=Gnomoniopsis smithogilvyi TaxID=1191159 RepID=A0A9W8Z358_9PEZI|nr:hypothetical protein N0V93_000951 [Gnomoniopsis smithogilvyi]